MVSWVVGLGGYVPSTMDWVLGIMDGSLIGVKGVIVSHLVINII